MLVAFAEYDGMVAAFAEYDGMDGMVVEPGVLPRLCTKDMGG